MVHTSTVIILAAILSLTILLILRSMGSRLYNRSAGVGLVLILFSAGLTLFDDLDWRLAALLIPLGLSIWFSDLFRRGEGSSRS